MGALKLTRKWILIAFFSSICIFGQGESAVPFLQMPNSAISYGAGDIGVSLLINDIMGVNYNPAILGFVSKESNFAYQVQSNPVDWLGISMIQYKNYGFMVGYNFSKKYKIPLSIGIGIQRMQFDFGYIDYEKLFDYANIYSIGLGWDWLIDIYAGFSLKNSRSKVGYYIDSNYINHKVIDKNFKFSDFGLMVDIPFDELIFSDSKLNLGNNSSLVPNTYLSLGYSYLNVGDEIWYVDPIQADPGPRMAKMGYTLTVGLDLVVNKKKISFVNYSFSAEADDILSKKIYNQSGESSIEYDNMFGKIQPIKNLISLKADNSILVHKGHIFNFFDSIYLLFGSMHGRGYYQIKTNGMGFSTKGVGVLLNALIKEKTFNYLFNHFTISYFKSYPFADDWRQTATDGIYFNINKIYF